MGTEGHSIRKVKTSSGLTLLETVLGSLLLSFAIIAMLGVWPKYAQAAERNRSYATASFLASQELEAAMAAGFANDPTKSVAFPLRSSLGGTETTETFQLDVTSFNMSPTLKEITVRVTWVQYNVNREIVLETLLAQ